VLETNHFTTRPIAVYYEEALAERHAEFLGYNHDGDIIGSVKKMEVM
jgi:hypothetical protein